MLIEGDSNIRTSAYVDGFNLYYGALKGTPHKWLDLVALTENLLPAGHTVEKVKYFTARVSGAADPNAPARQQAYLAAIDTDPRIEVHYGSFLTKAIWRPLINLPIAGSTVHSSPTVTLSATDYTVTGGSLNGPKTMPVKSYLTPNAGSARRRRSQPRPLADALVAQVHTMEEKGSDVNLAAHLLNDSWKGLFDAAVVYSNDTDLIAPISMVTVEQKKPVFVVCPGRSPMAPKLERVATFKRHLRGGMLSAAQLPDSIPGTTIRKPSSW